MLNLHPYTVFTFDCYGTLIDWETGIENALMPFLAAKGVATSPDEIISLYARFEPEAEKGEFKPYRQVLRQVMRSYASHFGFELAPGEERLLEDSVAGWPPFPDTKIGLQKLSQHVELGIISNIDEDLIRETVAKLAVNFAYIITAESVHSYKPSANNFREALKRIGKPQSEILHCAQSIYHDIIPAKQEGFTTVFVDRRAGQAGGAVPDVELEKIPWDLKVGSVGEIAFRYAGELPK